MKRPDTSHFIKKKTEVHDPDRRMSVRLGEGLDRVAGKERRDNVYILGLPGSGRSTLGRLLAERLGLDFVDLDEDAAPDDAPEVLRGLANESGKVVALGRFAVDDPGLAALLPASGRMVALMADVPEIMRRLDGDEALRERLVRDLNDLEPRLLAMARNMVRSDKPAEELAGELARNLSE
jgi:shikimate kinase